MGQRCVSSITLSFVCWLACSCLHLLILYLFVRVLHLPLTDLVWPVVGGFISVTRNHLEAVGEIYSFSFGQLNFQDVGLGQRCPVFASVFVSGPSFHELTKHTLLEVLLLFHCLNVLSLSLLHVVFQVERGQPSVLSSYLTEVALYTLLPLALFYFIFRR